MINIVNITYILSALISIFVLTDILLRTTKTKIGKTVRYSVFSLLVIAQISTICYKFYNEHKAVSHLTPVRESVISNYIHCIDSKTSYDELEEVSNFNKEVDKLHSTMPTGFIDIDKIDYHKEVSTGSLHIEDVDGYYCSCNIDR